MSLVVLVIVCLFFVVTLLAAYALGKKAGKRSASASLEVELGEKAVLLREAQEGQRLLEQTQADLQYQLGSLKKDHQYLTERLSRLTQSDD
jgi:hypothetical protein